MNIKRFIAAIVAFILIIGMLPAMAESVDMYINKNTVQVYSKTSTSSDKICVLAYGDKVTVTKYNSSWAQLTNSAGDVGYCRTYQLTDKDPKVAAVSCYAITNNVPVYKYPSSSSVLDDEFDCDDKVNGVAITPDKKWLRIEYGDGSAFVECKYFSTQAPSESMTVYVKSTVVTLRYTASDSASKTGSAYFGEEFALTRLSGSWGYISNGIVSGWCKTSSLTTKSLVGECMDYTAAKKDVKVYARNGKTLAEYETVAKGGKIVVVAFTPDENYALVECDDAYGYVDASDIVSTSGKEENPEPEEEEETPAPESITVYVSSLMATAYKSASASSTVVGSVSYGEKLTCTAVEGSFALVSNSVGKGWVKKSALTTKNPNSAAVTCYGKAISANVYKSPSESAEVLGSIAINVLVKAVAVSGDWARIEYGDGYAYVKKANLTTTKPEKSVTVYVRYSIVEAYKSASSSSEKIGDVYYGQKLERLSSSREWALVTDGSSYGWIKKDALVTTDPNTYNKTLYVNSDSVAVRKSPSSKGTKLTTMDKGDVVNSVAITPDGEWVRIKYNDSYAYIELVSLTDNSPAAYTDPYAGTAGETVEKIAALAVRQYGKPYVYAKEGPDSYDCSGLMYYCFEKCADIKLKRSGHDQGYDDRYPRVAAVAELKRGDIVVFDTIEDGDDLSDHTGLYLGGGLFIHASSSAGKVIVSDLSSGYYNRKFSWGLRVIQ